jgi:hypothetical protein
LFLSVRGFLDYAGPTVHSRLARLPCCLPPTRNEVGVLIYGLFAAQSPRPPMPLSTLQVTSRDVPCKTRGQDGFATSFPVGLLHPLQHAGLSRRSPSCPSSTRNRRDESLNSQQARVQTGLLSGSPLVPWATIEIVEHCGNEALHVETTELCATAVGHLV